jgi:hypothetical protein
MMALSAPAVGCQLHHPPCPHLAGTVVNSADGTIIITSMLDQLHAYAPRTQTPWIYTLRADAKSTRAG